MVVITVIVVLALIGLILGVLNIIDDCGIDNEFWQSVVFYTIVILMWIMLVGLVLWSVLLAGAIIAQLWI